MIISYYIKKNNFKKYKKIQKNTKKYKKIQKNTKKYKKLNITII